MGTGRPDELQEKSTSAPTDINSGRADMAPATAFPPAVGRVSGGVSPRTPGGRRACACAPPTRSLNPRHHPRHVKTHAAKTDHHSPPYQVAQRGALYELRIYGGYYVTRAGYAKNREHGLAALMGYVEGGNEEAKTFPATQPLVMRYKDSEENDGGFTKTMELSLGANVVNPPAPTTLNVCVAAAGGELLAVIGFEGIATPEMAMKYRELLTRAVEIDGLSVATPNEFRLATYGQLYSLKPRLNELMLKVKLPGGA